MLKKAQYGIPRPIGSQEIKKTKVATVLLDTLCISRKPKILKKKIVGAHFSTLKVSASKNECPVTAYTPTFLLQNPFVL